MCDWNVSVSFQVYMYTSNTNEIIKDLKMSLINKKLIMMLQMHGANIKIFMSDMKGQKAAVLLAAFSDFWTTTQMLYEGVRMILRAPDW